MTDETQAVLDRVRAALKLVPKAHRMTLVDVADLRTLLATVDALREDVRRYRATLELIATTDYRGNRSPESTVAFHALQSARVGGQP